MGLYLEILPELPHYIDVISKDNAELERHKWKERDETALKKY